MSHFKAVGIILDDIAEAIMLKAGTHAALFVLKILVTLVVAALALYRFQVITRFLLQQFTVGQY